jgi:hypothetical protein
VARILAIGVDDINESDIPYDPDESSEENEEDEGDFKSEYRDNLNDNEGCDDKDKGEMYNAKMNCSDEDEVESYKMDHDGSKINDYNVDNDDLIETKIDQLYEGCEIKMGIR